MEVLEISEMEFIPEGVSVSRGKKYNTFHFIHRKHLIRIDMPTDPKDNELIGISVKSI